MDSFYLVMIAIVAAALAFEYRDRLIDMLPFDDKTREAVLERRFYRDAEARGLNWSQASEELRLRKHLVVLRREASDRVVNLPNGANDALQIVDDIVRYQVAEIAIGSREDAKRYLSWVKRLPLSDILYPDAFDLFHERIRANVAKYAQERTPAQEARDRQDRIAALTVLKR